tara:strand:- start:1769 stop:1963 length:195 start_codon:yes stop_codon:yes gene_type:complete
MPLNNKEKEIIWQTFKVLRNTSTQIADCQDLWLSDIRDIETSFWSLYNEFEFIRNNCEKEKQND